MIVMGTGNGDGIDVDAIVLQDATYADSSAYGSAGITLASNGTATGFDTASAGPLSYTWLVGGTNTDYEVYCQANSGSISGTKSKWLSLGSNRTWALYFWSSTGRITLTIRNATTQVTVASAIIDLDNT